MIELLTALAFLGFILGAVCFVKLLLGSDKASKKDLEGTKQLIANATADDIESLTKDFSDEMLKYELTENASHSFEVIEERVKKSFADEKLAREKSQDECVKELKMHTDTEVANVKRFAEGKIDKTNLDQSLKKFEEEQKNVIEKMRDEQKKIADDGDRTVYDRIAKLFKDRTEQEEKQLDELKKALEDFKVSTVQKSEELRKAMGLLYPVEKLAMQLDITVEIAQVLIDNSYDSAEKIAEKGNLDFALTITGIELKDAVAIHEKAKVFVEKKEEPKTEAKTQETKSKPRVRVTKKEPKIIAKQEENA